LDEFFATGQQKDLQPLDQIINWPVNQNWGTSGLLNIGVFQKLLSLYIQLNQPRGKASDRKADEIRKTALERVACT
jgi:hypothetical protein